MIARIRSSILAMLLLCAPAVLHGADVKHAEEGLELHVVSIYEGATRTGNEIHGGRAKVTVDRPGVRVTLALAAYERVTWEVVLTPKTRLEQIILGGHQAQALKGVAESVEVVKAFRGEKAPTLYYCYKIDSPSFHLLVYQLSQLSKLPIRSFQAAYRYEHDRPFTVNQIQEDPRLSADYPRPTPLAELPDLTFRALHYVGHERLRLVGSASLGDFSLAGPKLESLVALPGGVNRVAYDPNEGKHYGIQGHDAVEVDLDKRTAKKMDVGFDVPQLSWPADVTFDTKRGRLLLKTSGGGGYLYAFNPATAKWTVLVEKPGVEAITYHPKHDCLYGLALEHDGDGHNRPVLCKFNSGGALLAATPLGEPIVPGSLGGGPGVPATQIVPADEFVALIASPFGLRREAPGPSVAYIYLVDPKKGKVWLTAKEKLPDAKE